MSHFPVNHPLRPLYRGLALLTGLFVLAFGAVGVLETQGMPMFATGEATALGLKTNPAFSYLSVLAGVLIVLGTVVGRNVDRLVYLLAGMGFLIAGTVMMGFLELPEANVLNFTIITVIVSYVIGSVLLAAGMYVKYARA